MAETLNADVTETGVNQGDLVKVLKNLRDVVNELQADHATFRTAIDAICDKLDADAGITDTNYAALHGAAGSGDAIPAALTNSTAITLDKG